MNLLKHLTFLLIFVSPKIVLAQKETSRKVNVVFILADDLGYGEVGCYGQTKIKTPNIDQLAKDGLRFTQYYVGAPVCAPSRCNLLTGKHAGHADVRNNFGTPGYKENINENGNYPLHKNTTTFFNLFKQAGYTTAAIGKWGLGNYDNDGNPLIHGVDEFYGYYDQRQAHNYYTTHLYDNSDRDTLNNPVINVHPKFDSSSTASKDPKDYIGEEYSINKMTAKALQFISNNSDKPFFLYLPYTLPHAVLQIPAGLADDYIQSFNEQPHWSQTNNGIPVYYPLSIYAAQVTYLDMQVGIILNALQRHNLDSNTIVIFASDNGASAGEDARSAFFNSCAGLRGFKADLYEGGIRDPFIIKWPRKVQPNTVSNQPVISYDMMQTFADLLQEKASKNDGVSLMPMFTGNTSKQKKQKFLYWEFPGKNGQVAVRINDWKGIKTGTKLNPDTAWHIYNIATDSSEKNDVAMQHPELGRKFTKIARKQHSFPDKKEWDIYTKSDPNAKPVKEAD